MDSLISTIADGAVAHHEIFISLVRAGFTEEQALELLKTHIIASSQR